MLSGLLSLGFVTVTVLLVVLLSICMEHFDASLQSLFGQLLSESPVAFFQRYAPRLSFGTVLGYSGWVASQALLYSILPGKIVYGPPTPGGHRLPYRMNGLLSWIMMIAVTGLAAYVWGAEIVASLAQNWGPALVMANMYGLALSSLAWVKGYAWPSFQNDRRFSGSSYHDFLAGIELNPRLGKMWDLKQFQIARIGMNSWVLIDLSFMALQYVRDGTVCNSMFLVIILHTTYIVDFFINEDWYLATIDIAHDHFGFNTCWGSAAWLPMVYTSQAQYLALHPVHLSPAVFCAVLIAGLTGYVFFRVANHQKHYFRQTQGKGLIAGSKPRMIRAQYTTTEGKIHESLLLCSGCWGMVRHPNYVGDLLFSFCTCVCCGGTHILPYIYFIFMTLLLIHRSHRDEKRCSAKYGRWWDEYKRTVRWRLIPGFF
ncbi:ergosterol biosynthesis ERG4/ERG24 [Aspergillus bertholletiae]|uniref:7-dehydrocholesterol reductase n=1 Tax=Aspergillus bertholletiae TaxID=1226010 RepID=A0A5N7BCT4_9EURO|nr:ergosterol biosynthesis ERG4/ERG24 [Aspergillus bertholletiae]